MIAAIWYGFIFYLSQIPASSGAATGQYMFEWNQVFRTAAHGFVFGMQSLLIFRECVLRKFPLKRAAVFAVVLTAVLGFLDEVHQYYVPGRFFRFRDILIDTAAAGVVAGVCYRYRVTRRKGLPIERKTN